MNEKELVEKIQAGDMNALGEIFETYKNQAFKYSYLITGNMYTSEDIVQEAFIKCYTNIKDLKNTEQFKSWFYKILTRIAWKHSSKDKKAYPVDNIFEKAETETKNVSLPDGSFNKVRTEIMKKKERGFLNMKFGFLKAKTVLAGLLCIAAIGTVGVGASSGLIWYSSSDTRKEITEFPKENIVEKRVGFSPKYVDSFSNGFKFESFNSSTQELENDNKDTITKTRSADFRYTRDGSAENQDLNFSAEKIEEQYADSHKFSEESGEYKGLKIYYYPHKYKAVPDGYKVTEEEQKMIDDGSLQVGYGDPSSEIEEHNIQSVSWYEDGIEYSIMNWNYDDLTKDQMIDMAKQVIDR